MALRLDLVPGDVVRIGSGTVVRVVEKSGRATRVMIESEYRVTREAATAPRFERKIGPVPAAGIKRPE
jgi:hypothetical protein